MSTETGNILVVDDDALNRLLIHTNLEEQGFCVEDAENGQQAMDRLASRMYDVVLLDLLMPVMDGFEVLRRMKEDLTLRHIPVIVISGTDEMGNIVRCIEMGAMDYLPKPFDPLLLKARLNASLAAKRLRDIELAYLEKIQVEQKKSEELLLNVLPEPIAEQLKQGKTTIIDHFPSVSVLFADLVGFTQFVASHTPDEMYTLLNTVFMAFDRLAGQHGLEKIKTIGDAYMVAGGLPLPNPRHLEAAADMAIDIHHEMERLSSSGAIPQFQVRIGIHTGPVVAGVIGQRKFAYDLWGDTVNTASRLHTNGQGGKTLVTETVYELLKDRYQMSEHGTFKYKGLSAIRTYWLEGKV